MIPKIGPSMSTSSYFPFNTYQTRRIEESDPKTDIRQHENKEESTSDNKITYVLKPSDFTKKTGKIGMIALGRASTMLDKHRADNGLPKIEIPPEKLKTLYNFLQKFINFEYEDGKPYILETGSGKPLVELVQQPTPALEYNDVRNDPYFITK
jgi:hypothetical protein